MIQGVPRGAGNGIAGGREKEAAVEKKRKKRSLSYSNDGLWPFVKLHDSLQIPIK